MGGEMGKPQAMEPRGLTGRVFGWMMERLNAPTYEAVIRIMAPANGYAVLDVGFGTGAMLARLADHIAVGTLAGIDPSALMVETARVRLQRYKPDFRVDLQEGTVARLPWADQSFDTVTALHSFQFWEDPGAGLSEAARVLRHGGKAVFVLRDHGKKPPQWLPNPLSRAGDEAQALKGLLRQAGFDGVTEHPAVSGSKIVSGVTKR